MDRALRFEEFIRRMRSALSAESTGRALELLSSVLNQVEEELSGIPFQPNPWQNDGRMYPPQSDSARDVEGRPDLTRYRSRNHDTWIGTNGAILIRAHDTGRTELDKAGADGCLVDLNWKSPSPSQRSRNLSRHSSRTPR